MSRWIRLVSCVALAGLGACGGDDGNDKPVDGSVADAPVDSLCGADKAFESEVIDWVATKATFCGVNNATATVRGATAKTAKTAPNGRLQLCLASKDVTLIDVAPSATASDCTTPKSPYPNAGVIVVTQAQLDAGVMPSARFMTADTMMKTFNTGALGPYNAQQAQLVVHLTGPAKTVTLGTPNHSVPLYWNGTAWVESADSDSATATDVFFPNIDSSASTKVTVGTTDFPLSLAAGTLEPGKFTYVTFVSS